MFCINEKGFLGAFAGTTAVIEDSRDGFAQTWNFVYDYNKEGARTSCVKEKRAHVNKRVEY